MSPMLEYVAFKTMRHTTCILCSSQPDSLLEEPKDKDLINRQFTADAELQSRLARHHKTACTDHSALSNSSRPRRHTDMWCQGSA